MTFGVAEGEFFGILGPNGAGKTTIPEIIEGLREADEGDVSVLGLSPLAFLGGSFFPLDATPGWMRALSYVFPLRYLNEGMLNVMGRGLGPTSALPQIGILLGVAVVGGLVAMRLFRWDSV
ncbi:ATP-binding cassette domain-containing protein [Actinomadura sp. 9N215]|uniref:ABC transporter permease n=1 Tax=Actinomadura sp. 9N215 TaxID=3375150 RepID=UPI00379CE51F